MFFPILLLSSRVIDSFLIKSFFPSEEASVKTSKEFELISGSISFVKEMLVFPFLPLTIDLK